MMLTTLRKLPSVTRASRPLLRLCCETQFSHNEDTCSDGVSRVSYGYARRCICTRPRSTLTQNAVRSYSKKLDVDRKQGDDGQDGGDVGANDGLRFKLTDLEPVCWGGLSKFIRKSIESFFFRAWFDPQWNEEEFLTGAVQAVTVVSDAIARGDFAALEGLVDVETIKEVRSNYDRLTADERQFIKVFPDDFIFSVVHQLGFQAEADKKFVAVTVVLHGFEGAANRLRSADSKNLLERAQAVQEATQTHSNEYYVLNYCFRKRIYLQAGAEAKAERDAADEQWTITALNHFKLDEYKKVYMWRR